jgi:hypothetical protein
MRFLSDTRHLWILALLIAAAGTGFVVVRRRLVPESFGQQGPYRAAALRAIAAQPSVLQGDAICHQCHQDIQDERAESLHNAVRCTHCHGLGREHVAQARKAAESPQFKIAPAAKWDGDFATKIDLFVTKDQKTCLACHEAVVGMPKEFRKIDVAKHLEEMGASEPASRETCFECHGPHNTAP